MDEVKKRVTVLVVLVLLLVSGGLFFILNFKSIPADRITGAAIGEELQVFPEETVTAPLAEDLNIMNAGNASQCGGLNKSITLVRNINTAGTCFIINASNIIIDGSSFLLQGSGTGAAINATNFTNITIKNVIILNFSVGIYFENTNRSVIFNTSVRNGSIGIYLRVDSELNNISSNQIINNSLLGISLEGSPNNTIYNNYFANNTNHAWDNATNNWNITATCDLSTRPEQGYVSIINGPCLGGNFFGNYTPNRSTFDGLGSTAVYFIPGGKNNDSLPLEENISLGCQTFTNNKNLSTEFGPLTVVGAATGATDGCIIAGSPNIVIDGKGTKIIQRIAVKTADVLGFGILANASNVTLKNFVVEGWSVGTPLQTASARTNITIGNITLKNMNSTALDYAFSFAGNDSRFSNITVLNTSAEVYGVGLFHIGPANNKQNTFTNINFTNIYGGIVLLDAFNNTFDNLSISNVTKYSFYEFQCNTAAVTGGECKNTIYDLISTSTDTGAVHYKTNNKAGTQGPYRFDIKHRVQVNITNNTKSALSGVTVEAKNINGVVDDSQQTDANGLATLSITEYATISGIPVIFTPHTFSITKANFTNYFLISTITSYSTLDTFLTPIACGQIVNQSVTVGANLLCSLFGLIVSTPLANFGLAYDYGAKIDGGNYVLTGSKNFYAGISLNRIHFPNIKELSIVNFSQGLVITNLNHSFLRHLIFHNNTYAIYFSNATNNTLYDSNVANNTLAAIDANGYGRNCFVNSSVQVDNISVVGEAEVCRKWYVTINVSFNGGNALPLANVFAYSNYTHELENYGTTDENGLLRLEITDLVKNVSGYIQKTPHNFTINYTSATGTVANYTVLNISLTNNTYINFSVTLDCIIPRQDMNITNNTVLCPGTYNFIDEEGEVGVILFNASGASNVRLTCDNTKFRGNDEGVGIKAVNKRNITITGCSFENYNYGVLFSDVNNSLINNTIVRSMDDEGIRLVDSFNNTLSYSQLLHAGGTSEVGLMLRGSANNTIYNNTFTNNTIQVYIDDGYTLESSTNTFYFNRFTATGSTDIYQKKRVYFENFFNKTIAWGDATKNFGNYYEYACSLNLKDTDDDGVYNYGNDFPYNHSSPTQTKSDAYGVDYAPLVVVCNNASAAAAAAIVSAVSGSRGSSAAAAATTAQAVGTVTTATTSTIASPTEAAQALSASVSTSSGGEGGGAGGGGSGGGSLFFKLRNNGGQTIVVDRLVEETLSDVENAEKIAEQLRKEGLSEEEIKNRINLIAQDPQTLEGRRGTLFGTEQPASDIIPSGNLAQGEIANIDLPDPETIVLPPCSEDPEKCEYHKEIQIIPQGNFIVRQRPVTVTFTVAGKTISQQSVSVGGTIAAGSAVEYTPLHQGYSADQPISQDTLYTGLLDMYAIIPPSKDKSNYWVEFDINTPTGEASGLTGAAVGLADTITLASDLLGPFKVEKNESLMVAQQYLHTDAYQGPAEVVMKILQDGKIISEKSFPVVFAKTTGIREGISSWIFYLAVVVFLIILFLPVIMSIVVSRKGLPKKGIK